MKITNGNVIRKTITEEFTIELDNGEEIIIEKFMEEGDFLMLDTDWQVVEGNEAYYKLTDEEKDKVDDFIIYKCIL